MDGSGPRFVDAPDDPPAAVWTASAPVRRPPPPPPSLVQRLARWWPLAVLVGVLGVVAGLLLRFGDTSTPVIPRSGDVQVLYLAEEGDIVEVAFTRDAAATADRALHDELWAEWSSMIPPYWSRRVARFEIASDGPGGIAASVQRLDDAGDRWLLSVDPVDAVERREDYVHTLVHELAHIVTLGAGRVDVDPRPASTLVEQATRCGDAPPVVEGCAAAGSVLAAFSETFWDLDEVGGPDGVATIGDREDATIERYLQARDRYVSAYAASGPSEDIAETFTAMALDHPQPRGSVAAAKVEFLRADAELFALADRIRATLRER